MADDNDSIESYWDVARPHLVERAQARIRNEMMERTRQWDREDGYPISGRHDMRKYVATYMRYEDGYPMFDWGRP
jgi:hypothetical protein